MAHWEQSATVNFMREILSYMGNCDSTFSLLHSIHKSLKSIIYAENFFVALLNSTKRYVTFPYYCDVTDSLSCEELNNVPLEDIFKTLTFYAIKKKKMVCLTKTDINKLIDEHEVSILGTIPEQWLCFPLIYKELFLGTVVIQSYRTSDEYDQDDVALLSFISNVIAAALYLFNKNGELAEALAEIQKCKDHLETKILDRTAELECTLSSLQLEISKSKELEKQLTYEAFHDNLTGLYNRKYFVDHLEIIASRCKREKMKVYIAFLDLDGFKLINDNHGHVCGDHILKVTAQRLRSCFRRHDILARFGGDEFVVLISTDITMVHLKLLLERIINSVASPVVLDDKTEVSVGVSIGVAYSDQTNVIQNELLAQADNALYKAKKQGKSCFVFDS
ncbi:MAG: sensor domain-containing diguanylate cyclase [Alteromonadaceae bacterium]|nr:sensor domain-containing diguanylate cyclase [Alteromonadaceae bacterium]